MPLRGGRYEVLQSIASGGMAAVHLARALGEGGFERLVAIKVMHPHIAEEPEFVAMFLDEARLAAQIRHPNVVGTTDVQRDEEGIFLVMEYVEGPSLHLILRTLRNRRMETPLPVLLRIFLDSLAGLHAAHQLIGSNGEPLNVVHRDVSPQNILVGVDGVSRITDFGVARAESRLANTKSGQVKGKAGYIAPEQLRSIPLDRRTDVYAAGVLLWEILAEERLIQGDSDLVMLSKILAANHRHPRERNARAPEALGDVAMRAIDADPAARYASAAAFAEAVEAAARACGIVIASARDVAAFVRELDAHVGPLELTPVLTMPSVEISMGSFPGAAPSPRVPPPVPSSAPETLASASPPSSVASPPSSVASPTSAAPPVSEAASVVSLDPNLLARRSQRGLLIGVGAGALVTSVLWWLIGASGGVSDVKLAIASDLSRASASIVSAAASLAVAEAAKVRAGEDGRAHDPKREKEGKDSNDMKDLKKDAAKPPLAAPDGAAARSPHEPSFRPKDL